MDLFHWHLVRIESGEVLYVRKSIVCHGKGYGYGILFARLHIQGVESMILGI